MPTEGWGIGAGIGTAIDLYKRREEILSLWQTISSRLLGRNSSLLVTGMPGIGKSVLLDFLTGAGFKEGYKPPLTSQSVEHGRVLRIGKNVVLQVAPGQQARPRVELFESLVAGDNPVDGVVHLVANGFATTREAIQERFLLEQRNLKTLQLYREARRADELEDLRLTCEELRRLMSKHRRPMWMIIAVAKVDLFVDTCFEAEKYYAPTSESAFAAQVNAFQAQVGSDNFRWTTLPVCTWLSNFTWNSEIVRPQLGIEDRDEVFHRFAHQVVNHCAA